MSHGYVDDIPGHAEFWRRFKGKENHDWRRKDYKLNFEQKWKSLKWKIYGKQKYRFRLLCRLINWRKKMETLGKINPKLTKKELENLLIQVEAMSCVWKYIINFQDQHMWGFWK